jgi:hypothetical protein
LAVIRLHKGAGVGITKVRVIVGDFLLRPSFEVAWAVMVYVPGINKSNVAVGIGSHG